MRSLLIVNPNMTEAVTQKLADHATARLADSSGASSSGHPRSLGPIDLHVTTARFGAAYISSETSFAIATHALLDAYAAWVDQNGREPDATLIGCFGDPGLQALREGATRPVNGLASAAFAAAARHGRFAIVTGGERWQPMLERLAIGLGHREALAAVHTVAPTGGQLAADPDGALRLLTQACRDVVDEQTVDAVILGGAGLAGLAAMIQPHLKVPVIDSVLAGIDAAIASLDETPPASATGSPEGVEWRGLSTELSGWLRGRL